MDRINVNIIRLANSQPDDAEELPLPSYETAGAAGMDLAAALSAPIELGAGKRTIIPTGFAVSLPQGFEAQIRPRSGLALKHGITVANAPGTVDADYRGEICVILVNLGDDSFTINHGMRIAQMVIAPVTQCQFTLVETLEQTERGSGGFGSTGV